MKKYFARIPNGFKQYLGRSTLMQECLDRGAEIWEEDESGKETLIATPEGGFLCDPPVFPVPQKMAVGTGTAGDTQEALNIILGIKETAA